MAKSNGIFGLPAIGFAVRRGGRVVSAQARPPAKRSEADGRGGRDNSKAERP